MTKHTKGAKSASGHPPRYNSSIEIEEPGPNEQGAFAFPPQHRLVITTTKGVYTWDVYGVTEIFRSGSEGIMAAKRVAGGGEMLAVADSEVVVLHEFNSGLQKSYRLKGSEGRVRLLKVDKESKTLFFTTTLQNSVQSYSLQKSKLLDPSHNHPSPPSVFAISCNSRFLLSTSVAPPTIYLTNLSLQAAPVLLRPYCSSSSVVAAAFHPENEGSFLLAFADGTAAVFDALQIFHPHDGKDRRRNQAIAGSGGEKAFVKGLHGTGTSGGRPSGNNGMKFDGYDPGTGVVGIGNRPTGITAVAFVPGRSATAVTVGADGKCCVVDFTQVDKHKAVLLKSWHVRRPATSLSIICYSKQPTATQLDGATNEVASRNREKANGSYYIAIGRQDGRLLLFDLNGKLLGHQALDADGSRIIDVEWTPIEGRHDSAERPRRKARPSVPRLPITVTTNKGLSKPTVIQDRRQKDRERPSSSEEPERTANPLFDFSTQYKAPEAARSKNQRKEPSIGDTQRPGLVLSPILSSEETVKRKKTLPASDDVATKGSHIPIHTRRVSESSAHVTSTTPSNEASPEKSPPVPPRPSPKPGGRLSKRHAQTARQTPNYLGVVSEARRMSSNPRVTGALYGPRQAPSPKAHPQMAKSSSSNTPASSTTPTSLGDPKVVWTDAAPEPPLHAVPKSQRQPPEPPRHQLPEPPQVGAAISPISSDSRKSYKTASSHLTSEASDDTVVTWSASAEVARRPIPTLQPTPQNDRSPKAPVQSNPQSHSDRSPKATMRSEPKGHISLSVSSESRETSLPTSPHSNSYEASVTAQSPVKSPKQQVPKLHLIHPKGEWPQKKGHNSVPVSTDTAQTETPISCDSDDQVVLWPSLKKSPRITELHKGLPDPSPKSSPETVKESVTGIVIKGYQRSPSPSTPPQPKPSHIPLPSSTSASSDAEHHRTCNCAATVETLLHNSFTTLRVEMMHQFEAQRVWFECLVRGEENERNVLAVENRWLRNELARIEKENGVVGDKTGRKVREV